MRIAHGANEVHVCRRARNGDAGAFIGVSLNLLQRALNEIGQLQIFKKDIEKLILGQRELE